MQNPDYLDFSSPLGYQLTENKHENSPWLGGCSLTAHPCLVYIQFLIKNITSNGDLCHKQSNHKMDESINTGQSVGWFGQLLLLDMSDMVFYDGYWSDTVVYKC